MRRMFTERDRAALGDRLAVWRGPLPFNLVAEPFELAKFARTAGATTVMVDSLGDVASPLSNDDVGAAVKTAMTSCTEEGIEFVALHHQRKATSGNQKPTRLDDVYGSRWITAGAGSVVLLWGEPGDAIVELTHLKQPADQVGPLELLHDKDEGITTVLKRPAVYDVLAAATSGGTTAKDAVLQVYGAADRNGVERARRKLEQLVKDGYGVRIEGAAKGDATVYRPVDPRHRVTPRDPQREGLTEASRTLTDPDNNGSRGGHAPSRALTLLPDPRRGEERAGERDVTEDSA